MSPWTSHRFALRFFLACMLAAYVVALVSTHPTGFFGLFGDDAIYFSSAQALAQGRGYILPGFPGAPRATKYPVLYPWLLAWIWRWRPSFPENLKAATGLTALFGGWFLLATFQFLRRLRGLGEWAAVMITGWCALYSFILLLSGSAMSDIPFMAVAMTAMVAADGAMRKDGQFASLLGVGILAGISTALRTLGLPVVAGIAIFAFRRRAFRQAALFCLVAIPIVLATLWPAFAAAQVHLFGASPGWQQTYDYTTSYTAYWKDCVPRLGVLLAMLRFNLQVIAGQPGSYLVAPLLPGGLATTVVTLILSALIVTGIVRQARGDEWKPVHFSLLFTAAMVLPWNVSSMDRFLLLFLPLFLAGLWVESRNFLSRVLIGLRSGRPVTERILANAMLIIALAFVLTAGWNYVRSIRLVQRKSAARAAILVEKRQAYDWIRVHAAPGATIVAYEDAALYLYTGRTAVRPLAFSTAGHYGQDVRPALRDLAHLTDVAHHVHARYWVMSNDYYALEPDATTRFLPARVAELKKALPEVFSSREARVRIYDLACVSEPQRAGCSTQVAVLFPAGISE